MNKLTELLSVTGKNGQILNAKALLLRNNKTTRKKEYIYDKSSIYVQRLLNIRTDSLP